ncbi:MAG: TonB-dependent receptor [Deltaproteobacteria bacterium]|nr:TonB-dependent receptor [Deltaproteobacteria bacterium]
MRWLNLQAGAFVNVIDDVILPIADASGKRFYQNEASLSTSGIEGEIAATPIAKHLTIRANYTYVDGKNQTASLLFNTPFIAKHIANVILVADLFDHLQLTPYLQYHSQRGRDPSTGDPRPPKNGYALLNLNVRIHDVLVRKLEFFLHATNILDTKYTAPSDFPPKVAGVLPDDLVNPGFRVLAGARYNFL